MSNTPPSDPTIVNTQALEGIMRAFDRCIDARYGLGSVEPQTADPLAGSKIYEFEAQVATTLMGHVQPHAIVLDPRFLDRRPRRTFRLVKTIVRIWWDSIRLRRYNREWLKITFIDEHQLRRRSSCGRLHSNRK